MKNKRYKKNSKLRTIAVAGTFIILSPFMVMALISSAPSADTAIIFAANSSARLTVGDVFKINGEIAESSDKIRTDDAAAELRQAGADIDEKAYAYLSFDDSSMLSFGALDIPSSENEELYVEDEDIDEGPKPYPEEIESRDGIIKSIQYGTFGGEEYVNLDRSGQVRNVTSLSNEILAEESRRELSFTAERNGEPQILIMHTHTTESYEPYERDFYDKSFSSRTTDERMNMVAVGNTIKEELEKAGIAVIHDTTMHDYPSYNGSYDRSRETVQKILDDYPSIKIVLDIHRDAIERPDGSRVAPVTEINGKNAAQVMLISGCDDGTMDMPDYLQNFRFASKLQAQLESDYPTLTRPLLFDYRKYNQDLTTGSVLVEVGGHANSIDQALYSGELIGKSLVDLLT